MTDTTNAHNEHGQPAGLGCNEGLGPVVDLPRHPEHGWTWTETERRFLNRWAFDYAALCVREATSDLNEQWRAREAAQHEAMRALVKQCASALAEELAAWDIDPPLHHVKEAHDACVAWLAGPNVLVTGQPLAGPVDQRVSALVEKQDDA